MGMYWGTMIPTVPTSHLTIMSPFTHDQLILVPTGNRVYRVIRPPFQKPSISRWRPEWIQANLRFLNLVLGWMQRALIVGTVLTGMMTRCY